MTNLAASDIAISSLKTNLPCLQCGYNLRTLPADARCPECSTPIASSLDPALLRFVDPSWTSFLAHALGLMLFAGAIQLTYTVTFLLASETDAFLDHATPLETANNFARLLFWLGVFFLGSPPSDVPKPKRFFTLRRLIRISAVFSFSVIILEDIPIWDVPLTQLWPIPLTDICDTVATVLFLIYLFQISRRSGRRPLVRHAVIALIIIPMCAALALGFNHFTSALHPEAHFAPSVAWILVAAAAYQLFIFFLFRRTLKKSAAFARQYWHFCSPIPQPHAPT